MRILIEGYAYRAEAVREEMGGLGALEGSDGRVAAPYVGYHYNPAVGDCVFILPKVLLDGGNKVFSRMDPHYIVDPGGCAGLTAREREFLYGFAVWVYRAIAVYDRSAPGNGIVLRSRGAGMGRGGEGRGASFLDVVLTLLRFNKDHSHFLAPALRSMRTGLGRTDWRRTIAHTAAWMDGGTPVYTDPVGKRRAADTDEELVTTYYSILRHITREYGFRADTPPGLELIPPGRFAHHLRGYGLRRLRQIRHRYFSDTQLRLWELCRDFFAGAGRVCFHEGERSEYLVAKNFNIVFEAMIDELVGDKEPPRGLKDQGDGKRVDHIFSHQGLIGGEGGPVYYIGDSKYYKIGNPVSGESVYKQFTYARNVVQWNVNLFLDGRGEDEGLRREHTPCRDPLTEGYNIVPNFFISAKMDGGLSYADSVSQVGGVFVSRHFDNRLFDRDTLLVCHYGVNFLYVLSLYARGNAHQKALWKRKVRRLLRAGIQKALQERYVFYAVRPRQGVDCVEYLERNFRYLIGKVYRPFGDPGCLSLALERRFGEENEALLAKLGRDFHVWPCPLGEYPGSA